MSFSGSAFGSGGFGSSNTNTGGSLFGGGAFGSNNNNNTGGGFGTQNAGTFGSTPNNTAGGFGTLGSTNTNPTFGAAKTTFGSSNMNTGGGFFGNNNNASTGGTGGFGGGGFGSATNNNNPTFGSGTASGGGLFGAPKPTSGFGTTGATMFGASGFGAANNTNNNQTGFGSSPTTGPAAECQGTLQPQFAVTTEKEANSSAMNHFQSIVHMPNYQRWSFEELRLADYRSGRQFANANGQAGTFGASTGFGGFSNNNNNQNQGGMFGANNNTAQAGGGLFGNNNNANTGFGTNNQASSPFGGFGANKPAAAGGLFGAPTNNATQNAGSMFGGAGSGFGAPSTGTGFGANNNTAGGFSSSSAAKPTLFGTQPTGPSLFANVNTNNNNTGGGLFGSSNQNQTGFGNPQSNATPNAFTTGSTLGGGTFGSNPANKNTLFSSTPATNTGSMFGGAPQSNQTGGLFGNTNPTNNNSNSNSLFGSKPAASSLFGNQPQPQNQGTGLFGNTQQNQPAQGGLFGGTNNQGGGLFGSSNSQNNTGTGIFGNQPQQQPQQQPQNSLFGNLSNTNQLVNLQPPQGLNASIFDPRPYGSVSIYDGLPPPSAQNIGPIATPISAGQRQMKPAVLPQWKLNPTMSPRFVTPQKQGYGFSYSRYGTPSSISSVASTPGHFGNSLLGASFGRTIGKSVSVSNLRRNYDSDTESVLAPGAFTASSRLGGQHSLKRLNIDRSLRNDLFAPVTQGSTNNDKRETRGPSSLKKRVSFEANSLDENQNEDSSRNESSFYSPTPSAKEQGYLRSSVGRNMFNGQPTKERRSQETSPIKVNELAIVPEDEAPETSHSSTSTIGLNSSRPGDPEPGKYSTRPSIEELKKLTPEQLKKVSGFVVSRENVGSCAFQRSVDLSGIKWNTFFDLMVKFTVRSICVYPDQAKKPPLGMGMNVPSIITLENCWPRSHSVRSGPRLDKHIRHLKSVKNCEFISYNVDKGEWSFRVPHFTTYGLDYDDDDDMDTDTPTHNSSMLSDTFSQATLAFIHAAKERPVNSAINQTIQNDQDSNIEDSGPEDTFSFKGTKQIPGGFDAISVSEDEEMEMQKIQRPDQSFLDDRSAVPESEDEGEPSEIEEGEDGANQLSIAQDTDLDIDMAGAFPEEKTHPPKPILKQTTFKDDGHRKLQMLPGNDWTEQLQRTISPQKRDRQELKASQAFFFRDLDLDDIHSPTKKSKIDEPRLETSIDLMNSLFGKEDSKRSNGGIKTLNYRKGFKWPYNKDVERDSNLLDENEHAFHESFKPRWGPGNLLVHAIAETTSHLNGNGVRGPKMTITGNLASEGYDIRLSKFTSSKELTPAAYERQFKRSNIVVENGLPFAKSLKAPLSVQHSSELTPEEVLIWKLASILFDKHSDDIPTVIPADQKRHYGARIQKDRLSKFWKSICKDDALHAVGASRTAEERAIHYLSMGAIVEACDALIDGKDFRLATLISQIGGDKIMQQDMVQQIKEWRRLNVISEMSESIRALYEMLAGNVCLCEGRQGPIEDRASTFTISQKYNLTWSRSFGLRLWYAIADDEPLEAAVKSYLHDLSGPETSKPKPWFLVKHGSNPPWPDSDPEGREDVIWGILKLFTYHKDGKFTTKLSDVVAPENVRGNPIDNRLSWELYFALLPYLPQHQSSEAADRLTTSFAAELESANHRMWAIFILLHLHNAEQRQVAIRDILARQAAFIDIDNAKTQDILFNQFHIPEAWIYEAKALFSRAVEQDRITELRYLQRAGNWTEAHNVICRTVAPKAIIERDHHTLSKILDEFEKAEKPYTWRTGGAVYQDYLKLLSTKDPVEHHKLIKRLLRSIPDMANTGPGAANKKRKGTVETGSENEGFLRSIAIKEMSWVVGDMLLQDQDADREHALILNLPLSDEMRRERSREIGLEYYRKVMAVG